MYRADIDILPGHLVSNKCCTKALSNTLATACHQSNFISSVINVLLVDSISRLSFVPKPLATNHCLLTNQFGSTKGGVKLAAPDDGRLVLC